MSNKPTKKQIAEQEREFLARDIEAEARLQEPEQSAELTETPEEYVPPVSIIKDTLRCDVYWQAKSMNIMGFLTWAKEGFRQPTLSTLELAQDITDIRAISKTNPQRFNLQGLITELRDILDETSFSGNEEKYNEVKNQKVSIRLNNIPYQLPDAKEA